LPAGCTKKLIQKLMGSSDPKDRARIVAQARLVEAYERSKLPRATPTLPVLLAYIMDQHRLSRADLVPLLGTVNRVSEVLSGKRDLSMTMVRRLRERCWGYGDEAASGNVKLLGPFAS